MKIISKIFILLGFIIPFQILGNNPVQIPDITYSAHPRILLQEGMEKQLLQNISADSIWYILQQRTLKACDDLIPAEPLKGIKVGKRLLGTSREALYRIFMLSYAYRTTGDKRYAERAEKELLTVCRYKDWGPEHFLDAAEMTLAVSIGYDWIYGQLGKKARKEIKNAIMQKGLLPSLDSRYNNFLNLDNNWNQVCNTAMAYGALAIVEDEPELAEKIIARSIESISNPMKRYGPDGAYPEGYGYWHYGTTYNVMMLALLEQTYGTDFGLSAIPGFMKSPYYIMHMVSPTLRPFNFGDSVGGLRLNTSLFWFAKKMNDPSLISYEIDYLLRIDNYKYEQYRRMLPSIFIFGNQLKPAQVKTHDLPQMFVAKNEAPVGLMRTSWDSKDAIYVGMKGGTPSANNHTHLDEGTFIMEAMGIRWAVDLGPQDYTDIEKAGINLWDNTQNSQRWNIYRYNNLAHNVFSINDTPFDVKGRAEIKSYTDTPQKMETTIELTPMYGGQLNYAQRSISIINKGYVMIKDLIANSGKSAGLTWRMLTAAKVEQVKGGFLLHQEGKSLLVSIPENTTAFVESATPPNSYDEANPGISIIGYKLNISPNSKKLLTVCLIPQQPDKTIEICNKVADWQIRNQKYVKHHDLDWTNGAWYRGLAEWAKLTDNEGYFDFLKNQGANNNWDIYYRPYHADDICVSQMYFELVKRYGNEEILKRTIERLDSVTTYPSKAPLMKTHPKGRDERWSWCDALFMAPPVYANLYSMTGNERYLDFMESEFKECTDSLYDRGAGLYYRDCSKIPLREPNGEKQFWARGNGWVFAAIPIILDILPADFNNRNYYLQIFREMAHSIMETQDQNGSWHASLLDPGSYPQPENSASGFFCYGMAWGMRNGILDKETYLEPTLRAWTALCRYVHEDGKLGYIQPVGHDPKHADENSTDVYGVGAFLLAGSEILRMEK